MVILNTPEKRRRRLEAELERILPEFKRLGAKKVILFGSLATGNTGMTSDIDLIIVKETGKRFLDRLEEFYTELQPRVGMDVLVYTPQEFEELKKSRPFVQRAVREGKVLYEA